jgi:hypothetical protein
VQEADESSSHQTVEDFNEQFDQRNLEICTILFVSLSSPPPHFVTCFLTSHVFFLLSPPHFVPLLGSFGGSKRCFWVTHGLPCLGATPPLSPTHPSSHFPPFKPVLFRVHPSLPRTFHFFPSPFPTSPSLICLCAHTPNLVSAFVSPLFSPKQMAFKAKALV